MRFPTLTAILCALLSFGTVTSAHAQLAGKHSLSLNVTLKASGGNTNSSSGTDVNRGTFGVTSDSSQMRTKNSQVNLLVQVRNFGQIPDNAKLEWYFVGNPVDGKNHIFDSGHLDLAIEAGVTREVPLNSRALQSTVRRETRAAAGIDPTTGRRLASSQSTIKFGAAVGGWMVRLMVDGKPYQIRASSPSLETVAKSEASLAAFPRDEFQ